PVAGSGRTTAGSEVIPPNLQVRDRRPNLSPRPPAPEEGLPTLATQEATAPDPSFSDTFTAISRNVGRVIQGKSEVIDLAMPCRVSARHLRHEAVPGVGKTSLAKALPRSIDSSFGRVQFTPDLLPSDVVGVTVWNRSDGRFEFRPGPIFATIVLGDE